MSHVDGRELRTATTIDADVAIVGSGPAGAAVARTLARAGARVVLAECGRWFEPGSHPADAFTAMTRYYRDMGASLIMGNAPMPYLQGRMVGGTSVINGAISWQLPHDVWSAWIAADPALESALPWDVVVATTAAIERDLNIQPTAAAIAGPNNLLLARGADALGIEHRPISRNMVGCRGLGRCMQGCPEGHKQSMDLTYLPDAMANGATIVSSCTVADIVVAGGRAVALRGYAAGGGAVTLRGARAIVLAASAVDTPCLLWRSGLRQGPVGEHFSCHPGVSMAGRFPAPVRMWTGATQGHEGIGLRHEGIKFEALGYDIGLVATRLKGFGRRLSAEIADLDHWANWGAAIKAGARGRVRPGRNGPRIVYQWTRDDVIKLRRGARVLGDMMLAAGADYVTPGIHGWHDVVRDRSVMGRLETEGPLDPKAYMTAVTHMFGTARMGSDAGTAVVRPDFRHHHVDGLYIADSSVFPSNTGVNPQTSILTLATLCGAAIAGVPAAAAGPAET